MIIDFIFPAWFLLLFPAFYSCWKWRSPDIIHNIIRGLLFLLVITALAQPRIKLERKGGVLAVIADRSISMPKDAREREMEIIRILEGEKGSRDMISVIGFAEDVYIEQMPEPGSFGEFNGYYSGTASKLAEAMQTAEAIIPKDRHGRILVLSDGRYTGKNPLDVKNDGRQRVPVDYRLMQRPSGLDLAVVDIDLPETVEPGETFMFPVEVLVPEKTEISYRLIRDSTQIAAGKLEMDSGRRFLFFTDRLSIPGNTRYSVEISSLLKDPFPENNKGMAVLNVHGAKPVLHAGNEKSRLIQIARKAGVDIVPFSEAGISWDLAGLSRFGAIILENYPANKIGYTGQEALKHSVSELGKGLMVSGGRQSFGVGGYYKSSISEILPVSMELRKEHRKLSTAVVVALDRSGSMAVNVSPSVTKMDLANEGTASVLELMSDNDYFGVLAVDSQAHVIVDMGKIGKNRNVMESDIRSIKSMGGGIFIYEALCHAAEMLSDVKAGTRHIILFADAADSEEPGKYMELITELRKNNITLSVIGLGSESDCDANLLKHIASLGGGNIYFSNRAEELPQLFAQETLTVFRGAFIEDETPVAPAESFPLVTSVPEEKMPPLGGYNLSYVRPDALTGIVTKDGFSAPALAFWTKGNGRCLAFTGEIDGKYSGQFGAWDKSGEIFLSCIRWVVNPEKENEKDFFVKSERSGGSLKVTLELDPERKRDPFVRLPKLLKLVETEKGIAGTELPMEWKSADSLACMTDIDEQGISHFSIQIDKDDGGETGTSVIPCTSQCLPYPQEFAPELKPERGAETLAKIAESSGGKERLSLDGIFESIPPFKRFIPLWHLLSLLAIFMLILEIIYRRTSLSASLSRIVSSQTFKMPKRKSVNFEVSRQVKSGRKPEVDSGKSENVLGAISKAREKSRERFKN